MTRLQARAPRGERIVDRVPHGHWKTTTFLGDIVVMDNLSSHKVELKALLRRYAERTVETLWNRIGALLDRFTSDECRNHLRHCGYRVQPE